MSVIFNYFYVFLVFLLCFSLVCLGSTQYKESCSKHDMISKWEECYIKCNHKSCCKCCEECNEN